MRRALRPASLLGGALLLASCGEEIAVRQSTRVHADGTIERAVLIAAREPGRKDPYPAAWIDAQVDLGRPAAWGRIERSATAIRAEGVFASAAEVPPTLAHPQADRTAVADHHAATLAVEDLGVLRVFTYEEMWGDPYGRAQLDEAIGRLSAIVARRLQDQVLRQFGGEVDPAPAVAQLRRRGEALARDVAASLRATQFDPDAVQQANLSAVLRTHGVPSADPLGSVEGFLEPVLSWARDLCARSLSTPERPVDPADLAFWPDAGDVGSRTEDSDPELAAAADALLPAVFGEYGWGDREFRVQATVRLPGRLVTTDGMPDGDDGAVWVFGKRELSLGCGAKAVSVELDRQALVDLGARRDFGPAALLELVQRLRALEGPARQPLEEALRTRSLAPLRRAERVDLLELLDPALPPWPEP